MSPIAYAFPAPCALMLCSPIGDVVAALTQRGLILEYSRLHLALDQRLRT